MQICITIINEVKVILTFFIDVIEWIVKTVCELVVTVIHFIKNVCEKVCGWLGIFSFLCDWVCKIVEWVEVAIDWVCKEVLVKVVIGVIRVIVEYVFYILTWVCWVIDWIPRAFDYLSCLLGLKNRRFIHVCVKVLASDRRRLSWNLADIESLLRETDSRLKQCNVGLCVIHFEIVETDAHRSGLTCGFSALFTSDHHWFRRYECRPSSSIIPITIFFVDDISGDSNGCSFPGANYVLVDHEATNAVIAHEIGHLADLWGHSDDQANIMFAAPTNDSVIFAKGQCCMIRSSKYATTTSYVCGSKRK